MWRESHARQLAEQQFFLFFSFLFEILINDGPTTIGRTGTRAKYANPTLYQLEKEGLVVQTEADPNARRPMWQLAACDTDL